MSEHRDRILAAALEVTATDGWGAVTMARLARLTGVSRQTVYNEMGTKTDLAQTLVADQLEQFLAAVNDAFASYPLDPVQGVRAAVHRALDLAEKNPVVRAAVSGSGGAAQDLAPLLTTRSTMVLGAATVTVRAALVGAGVDAAHPRLDSLVDVVVRVTISHMVQPGAAPEDVADGLAAIAGAVLTRHPDQALYMAKQSGRNRWSLYDAEREPTGSAE